MVKYLRERNVHGKNIRMSCFFIDNFDPKVELDYLLYNLPRVNGFYKQYYPKARFPNDPDFHAMCERYANCPQDSITSPKDIEAVKRIVDEPIDLAQLNAAISLTQHQSPRIEEGLSFLYKTLHGNDAISASSRYRIVYTRYGTFGRGISEQIYGIHTIAIRLLVPDLKTTPDNFVNIIIHEATHVETEPLVNKYKLDHFTKEALVDLICLNGLMPVTPNYKVFSNPIIAKLEPHIKSYDLQSLEQSIIQFLG